MCLDLVGKNLFNQLEILHNLFILRVMSNNLKCNGSIGIGLGSVTLKVVLIRCIQWSVFSSGEWSILFWVNSCDRENYTWVVKQIPLTGVSPVVCSSMRLRSTRTCGSN